MVWKLYGWLRRARSAQRSGDHLDVRKPDHKPVPFRPKLVTFEEHCAAGSLLVLGFGDSLPAGPTEITEPSFDMPTPPSNSTPVQVNWLTSPPTHQSPDTAAVTTPPAKQVSQQQVSFPDSGPPASPVLYGLNPAQPLRVATGSRGGTITSSPTTITPSPSQPQTAGSVSVVNASSFTPILAPAPSVTAPAGATAQPPASTPPAQATTAASPPASAPPSTPLMFEANLGQFPAATAFVAHDGGVTARLGSNSADFTIPTSGGPATTVQMNLIGGNAGATAVGNDQLPGIVNYLIGQDPSSWITRVPTYGQAVFQNVYPGVDMVYHADASGNLEYDFDLAPGANSSAIRLAFNGTTSLDAAGDLVVSTATGQLVEHAPVAYQGSATVATSFTLLGGGEVGFQVGAHNPSSPLVIDPTIAFSTFTEGALPDGGVADNESAGVAFDTAGNSYVAGTQVNAYNYAGVPTASDPFVAKYSSSGALVYLTYFGGSNLDVGTAIAVGRTSSTDATQVPYITGYTTSVDFPVTLQAYQTQLSSQISPYGAWTNAFLTKLSADGTTLLYSSYFGQINAGTDLPITWRGETWPGAVVSTWQEQFVYGRAIAVDRFGDAYIVGNTQGIQAIAYPVDLGESPVPGNTDHVADAFLISVDTNSGETFPQWNLFYNYALPYAPWQNDYGAWGPSSAQGVAVNPEGQIFVTGYTGAIDIYTSPNAFQPDPSVGLGETSPGGMGPPGMGPPGPGPAPPPGSGPVNTYDAFASKLVNPFDEPFVPDGPEPNQVGFFDYSTYLGGIGSDQAFAIAIDASGNAYITGSTTYGTSADPYPDSFPTTTGAFQTSSTSAAYAPTPPAAAFVSKISADGSTLVYSTLLGGSGTVGLGIAVDRQGKAYVVGQTENAGSLPDGSSVGSSGEPGTFPLTANATDTSSGGEPRAFLSEFNTAGTGLLFSTFHGSEDGGTGELNTGMGIALHYPYLGVGRVTPTLFQPVLDIVGVVNAQSIPIVNAAQPTFEGYKEEGFIAEFNLRQSVPVAP